MRVSKGDSGKAPAQCLTPRTGRVALAVALRRRRPPKSEGGGGTSVWRGQPGLSHISGVIRVDVSRNVNRARPPEKEPVEELASVACPGTWCETGLRGRMCLAVLSGPAGLLL